MKTKKVNTECRSIRAWLYNAIASRISSDADWVHSHIVNCQRCQRRLASAGRVNLAISIVTSQPHRLDLLMRANAKTISVLKHSLRYCPKVDKLKKVLPEPKLFEKCSKYKHSLANAAACIAILLLMKSGIFSSMDKFQAEGQKVVKQYYASHLGEELTDEIFSA